MEENKENVSNKNLLKKDEQEVNISSTRNEPFAIIYASDVTYITKLDKLCKSSPEMYSLIASTSWGNTYKVEDKSLIRFKSKKNNLSDEARAAISERFKRLYAEGKIGKKRREKL